MKFIPAILGLALFAACTSAPKAETETEVTPEPVEEVMDSVEQTMEEGTEAIEEGVEATEEAVKEATK